MAAGTMNFRRNVVADTKRKGGKGGKGNYYDRYRLPQNVAMPFLLVAGEYVDRNPDPNNIELDSNGQAIQSKVPYYKYRKHRRKTFKNGKEFFADEICSAGDNPHNPQQCVGCLAMDSGDKTVTLSDGFAITIVHLWPYHRHPLVDSKTGQIVTKKENNREAVLINTECGGRTCNFCRTVAGQPPIIQNGETWPGYLPNQIETVFGNRRYFELGKNHLSDLIGWDKAVGAQCGGSMVDPGTGNPVGPCRNQLTMVSYNCTVCSSVVIDMATDPRTDEQIDEAVLKPYQCMKCQRPTFLTGAVACERTVRNPQMPQQPYCTGALMYTIFDVVLSGMRQGENTNSHLFMQRYDTIEEFGRGVHPNYLGGKSFRDYIKEKMTPFDFAEMLKPKSLQDQAKRLDLPMPPSAGGGYGQQGNYGQQQPQNYGYQQPQQGQANQAPNYGGQPVQPQQQFVQGATQQPPPNQNYMPYPAQGQVTTPPMLPTQQPSTVQQPAPGAAQPPAFVPPHRPNFGN